MTADRIHGQRDVPNPLAKPASIGLQMIHRPTSPRQLPDLRLDLLRSWRPDGAVAIQAAVLVDVGAIRVIGDETSTAAPHVYLAEVSAGLQRADLWWVTEDM